MNDVNMIDFVEQMRGNGWESTIDQYGEIAKWTHKSGKRVDNYDAAIYHHMSGKTPVIARRGQVLVRCDKQEVSK